MALDQIRAELSRVAASLGAPGDVEVLLETPRDRTHGDVATNLALTLARVLKASPRKIAEQIVAALRFPPGIVESVEIAGPGFINFRLTADQLANLLEKILSAGQFYGRALAAKPLRVNVEFVSANPTGPLHVAHGRGAAIGDCVSTLLASQGHTVQREFYVNDAGVQILRLERSLWARVQQACGRDVPVPEDGYHGDYLIELARLLLLEKGSAFADQPESLGSGEAGKWAVATMLKEQKDDLARFGVTFDVFYEESRLHRERRIDATLHRLEQRGKLKTEAGALWLRSTEFGDDKDRVLKKSDGDYTYFTPDIAYHEDKAERGFERAIDVWGADHHGYVPRMSAAMQALGHGTDFFEALIVQMVSVRRDGEEVKMSKRSGEFITLRELIDEVGPDAARYFFLMRRADTPFVFDIDLALKKTDENPVFYVQMAHARMAGIFRNLAAAGGDPLKVSAAGVDAAVLNDPSEPALLKVLSRFPDTVRRAAEALEPQRITGFAEELAQAAHHWYHQCRVLGEPPEIERARLVLARATQIVLANALALLGVRAPERM
ncbi:MAG TPA: arginine--tRNA ligase [Gemmatimonadales bacterium]